jgi:hypothetical protein
MRGAAHVFQIYYEAAGRDSLDPDFGPLDNSANERPDWYEYWPIRRYLLAHRLEASSRYGFLSPLFLSKTQLSGRQVKDFLAQSGEADVVTFSPHPCHGAVFYNVFEQGNNCFPGFLEVATRFLREVDPGIRLEQVVNDSRNTVYSNYFVARPAFWEAWSAVCDRLFAHAENPSSPLYEGLNRAMHYAKTDGTEKPAQMKIFVMERIAPLLLATRRFTVRNYPPFAMPLSAPFVGHLPELVALDALKIAYAQTRDAHFLRQFTERRDRLAALVWSGRPAA